MSRLPLRNVLTAALAIACLACSGQRLQAESALELLSEFDAQGVADAASWLGKPNDEAAQTQVAQLLFQLRRVGQDGLRKRLPDSDAAQASRQPGDVIRWTGRATKVAGSSIPETQAEVLEMPRVFRFQMEDSPRYVITPEVPSPWLRPDGSSHSHAIEVIGIVVRTDEQGQPDVIAAPRAQWFPDQDDVVPTEGWRLLAAAGLDCGRLDAVRRHDKQPLSAEEPFYEMLAAAQQAGRSAPSPQAVSVLDLLKDSRRRIGQWVSLPVESVRVTKIVLPAGSSAAEQIGQDHYWQLDTFGHVDGHVVIEPTDEPSGQGGAERIEFANRYPVSLVAYNLPEPLMQAIERQAGRDAAVAMVRQPLSVQGFYYRQWSYDTEFVQSRHAGRQFGPLLMASRLSVRDVALPADGINWQAVVAGVFLVGLIAIAAGSWWIGRRDRQHVLRRRQQEMDEEFPLST
ncbi:hypothetical protein [Roseimaritima ulvae]|uniref:Uncharacterized protein n=1 Tax=Roseimaritima ulvae TaxID=980254 RepID=A0A5B9QUT4_9BACT|nr:hypothetical protein [Roseimaritima ulvae]QEG42798.1 hypothetical protein UC8_48400 [Roseimaritima ulvae]